MTLPPKPHYRNVVFDLHGVLLGVPEPIGRPSFGTVVTALREAGLTLRFLTNSSSVTPAQLAAELFARGVGVAPSEIVTAGVAVGRHLHRRFRQPRVLLIGSQTLRDTVDRSCGGTVLWCDGDEAEVVVVSRVARLDDATLDAARAASARGAALLATCRDFSFPSGGTRVEGPGVTVARIEAVMGRTAEVVGKPNPDMLTGALGIPAHDLAATLVVGDSPEQDVALAKRAGCPSVLIADRAGDGPEPDFHIRHLDQLLDIVGEVACA